LDGPRRGDDAAAPAGTVAGAGRAVQTPRPGVAVPSSAWRGLVMGRPPRLGSRGPYRAGRGARAGRPPPRRLGSQPVEWPYSAGRGARAGRLPPRRRGSQPRLAQWRGREPGSRALLGWRGRTSGCGGLPGRRRAMGVAFQFQTRGTALRNDEDVPTGLCLLLPGTPRPLTSITTLSQSDQSECRPNPPAPSLAFLPLAGLLLGLTFITGTTIMSNDYLTVSKSNGLTVHSSTNKRRWYSSFLGVASVTAAAVLQHSTKEIIVPPTSTKNFRAFLSCSTQSLSGKIKTLRRKTSNTTIENYLATRKEDTVLFFLLNVTNDMLLSRELQDIFSEEELEAIRSHGMGLPLSAKRWKLEDRLEEVRQKLDFLIVVFIPEKLFPFEGK
ncbi:hypothetical protein THAOC_15590, partial [Thalassiosira oceanica]